MARMIIVNAYVLLGIVKIYFLQLSCAKSNNIYIYIYIYWEWECQQFKPCSTLPAQ